LYLVAHVNFLLNEYDDDDDDDETDTDHHFIMLSLRRLGHNNIKMKTDEHAKSGKPLMMTMLQQIF